VAAAALVFDLHVPTQVDGATRAARIERDEVWLRTLFERAVGGFYRTVLSQRGWRVRTGTTLRWPTEGATERISAILPSMRTDIVLEHPAESRRIIIDTKFAAIFATGWYREQSLKSGYLYQIYAYLRTQERESDPLSLGAEGLLLHPVIGRSVDESVTIQGHRMRFATVDLTGDARGLREALLRVVGAPSSISRR
jgi:5-methylcytosine-specific restriction enzyme subunit McrC